MAAGCGVWDTDCDVRVALSGRSAPVGWGVGIKKGILWEVVICSYRASRRGI